MSIKYDDQNLTVTFDRNGSDYTISCMGLPAHVVHRLVLVGAVSLLKTKKYPMEAWENIKRGKFHRTRTKNLPKTVRAYAALQEIPEHEVWEIWKGLSKRERRELSKNKEIRKAVIDL